MGATRPGSILPRFTDLTRAEPLGPPIPRCTPFAPPSGGVTNVGDVARAVNRCLGDVRDLEPKGSSGSTSPVGFLALQAFGRASDRLRQQYFRNQSLVPRIVVTHE